MKAKIEIKLAEYVKEEQLAHVEMIDLSSIENDEPVAYMTSI